MSGLGRCICKLAGPLYVLMIVGGVGLVLTLALIQ